MATVTTTFITVNGMLVQETRGGVETYYIPDPLGSLVECRNSSGAKTYSAEYWPYGELQTSTGTNPSLWGFVGLSGYLTDSPTMLYVRARYLTTNFARWLTVDPLWPNQMAFQYCRTYPVGATDSTGLIPILVVACAACLPCLGHFIAACKDSPNFWQCVYDIWQELPLWVRLLCAAGCSGCIALIVSLLAAAAPIIIPILLRPRPDPIVPGPCSARYLQEVICTAVAAATCINLPVHSQGYLRCTQDVFEICMFDAGYPPIISII